MRIMVATDGSSHAAHTTELVAGITWPPDSILRIISVIEPSLVFLSPWLGGAATYSPDLDAQVETYQQAEMATVVRHLGAANRTVEGAVLRGRPATVIVDEASTFDADLVIVGSRGRGPIASLVLGSVSSEVVDHAPCPVLVARTSGLVRVVLAADGSPSAATAEAVIARWPIFDGLPIRVASVADLAQPWHTGMAAPTYDQVIEAHARDLKEATAEHQRIANESVERLRAAGRDSTAEVRTGDAASEIIAAAREWNADLVVLGSRGRTGLTRLLLGSVARNVVYGSAASILVVREPVRV
ncbi:MAG: universal stress protein [Chloroflexi bacterium]|nr:universal stress protein [Chloroflexota bacterium]